MEANLSTAHLPVDMDSSHHMNPKVAMKVQEPVTVSQNHRLSMLLPRLAHRPLGSMVTHLHRQAGRMAISLRLLGLLQRLPRAIRINTNRPLPVNSPLAMGMRSTRAKVYRFPVPNRPRMAVTAVLVTRRVRNTPLPVETVDTTSHNTILPRKKARLLLMLRPTSLVRRGQSPSQSQADRC